MPLFPLEFGVDAVLYVVQTFSFELGYVQQYLFGNICRGLVVN